MRIDLSYARSTALCGVSIDRHIAATHNPLVNAINLRLHAIQRAQFVAERLQLLVFRIKQFRKIARCAQKRLLLPLLFRLYFLLNDIRCHKHAK